MIDVEAKLKEIGPYVPAEDDELLVCRCEEVTKGEIRRAVHAGMFTIEEIRRFLRCGMGLCQGQTCGRLVKSIVARELMTSPKEVEAMGVETKTQTIDFKVGDNVEITDGPLAGFIGVVDAIDADNEKVTVKVSMFGRETETELSLLQVKPI